ncbi:hypothetical protein LTR56_005155 [Elasticomyces elasticus]|nr:hypothetical protein LTR56_005155 [Elasticomyces elasticus]KAK3659611.1 hypothetical protein LTR22_008341 [Elasticomyces elasticus]KAK4921313.1 hypothetical protein LTR49_011316 [Elasticomyces elasticus]KAK5759674.1 hypothetical protein LTS12_010191 [Elasticomyces elasticus]
MATNASSASPPISPQQKTRGAAFLLYEADDDNIFWLEADGLEETLLGLNYTVDMYVLEEPGSVDPIEPFKEWLGRMDTDETVSIVLAYFGHGMVMSDDLGEPLLVGDLLYEFTSLQEYLRDHGQADALTIVNCCYSGKELSPRPLDFVPPVPLRREHRHVETLAACDGVSMTDGHGFIKRLIPALRVTGKTVKELYNERIYSAKDRSSPGVYRNELKDGNSQLWGIPDKLRRYGLE